MQLSEARRPLCGQSEAWPTEVFSKAGNEVSRSGSGSTLPAHSAVHEVSTVVKCRGTTRSREGTSDVDRPLVPLQGASAPVVGSGGVDTEEFNRKCKGAYPVRPTNKPLTIEDCPADAASKQAKQA